MGYFFGLAVECGAAEVAHAMVGHFDGYTVMLSDGLEVTCSCGANQDPEGNWWAYAHPPGASATGTPGRDNPELRKAARMTEMGHLLYERLRDAPPFRYALAGVETSDFRWFSELDEDLVTLNFHGVVISESIWQSLGCPALFHRFRDGYWWRPYEGEEKGL